MKPRPGVAWGTVVEGPGFYVWEEDAREALLWGRELAGAVESRAPGGAALPAGDRTGEARLLRVRCSPPPT
jgi:hypothetical protein